jgi:anaerobic selenocysteine-containing dehydrogenase
MTQVQTHYRACNLCEATCGLEIVTEDKKIISIKGDKKDPLSRGYICPKGTAMQDVQNDPNRLRKPVKKVNGNWLEISYEEAFELVAENIVNTQSQHGNDSIGFYLGNPTVHNYGSLTHGPALSRILKTVNRFSATSLDQLPCHLASFSMYGHQHLIPVPDIDNCDYFVMLGANPMASNGSMWTVPDFPNRVKELKKRGGELVVIDPRKTETAQVATQHHFIKPGSDALFLMAVIHSLFKNNRVNLGHLKHLIANVEKVEDASKDFSPEKVAAHCGIDANTIESIAHKLATTPKAVCYGRMGISTQKYGALCNWAIQVINILCGNLDVVGGTMVTHPAAGFIKPGESGAGNFKRKFSRVSKLPVFSGELPAVVMAEEMLTKGEGQIKAFITSAGNPVLSSPNGALLDKAFESLDFMASIDIYINETTRHADVIIPPTAHLEHDHFDIAFLRLATRNTVRFNEAIFEKPEGTLHDWEILNGLAEAIEKKRDKEFQGMPEPAVLIDFMLQAGHYSQSENLSQELEDIGPLNLEKLKQHPHGIDLGPLRPSLGERICTKDGLVELAPEEYLNDIPRLKQELNSTQLKNDLLLIGRRHVRSCNSWMHNSHRLVKGKPRWQLLMHPEDMKERSIESGTTVQIQSRANSVTTEVNASEDMMPGVVSLPHGWGHQRENTQLEIASQQEGVSANDLTDEQFFDAICGNAGFNGVNVQVLPT